MFEHHVSKESILMSWQDIFFKKKIIFATSFRVFFQYP